MLNTTPHRRLQDDLAAIEEIAARPATTAKELAANLTEIYEATFNINFERYDVQTLVRSAPDIARTVFALRLRLREQVTDWQARGFLTLAGQRALRNALRIARYATDMLGETQHPLCAARSRREDAARLQRAQHAIRSSIPPSKPAATSISAPAICCLMRGMHHNSAAIARIGDVDSQFSHLAIVHTDADGKHWVVEALIEEGAVINSLAYTLTHGLGRCVLFRHKDKHLAARAAALIHDAGTPFRRKGRQHIWYDFTMELAGDKELFCSKLVRKAYRLASDKQGAAADFRHPLRHEEPRFRRAHRRHGQRDVRAGRHRARSRTSISSPSGRTTASPRACACRIC